MNRDKVLDATKELICNDRVKDYGTPKKNFTRIAKMWSVILEQHVSMEQVALCMLAIKITRLIQTPNHIDSWKDACGYSAIGGEVSELDEDEKQPNMWGV